MVYRPTSGFGKSMPLPVGPADSTGAINAAPQAHDGRAQPDGRLQDLLMDKRMDLLIASIVAVFGVLVIVIAQGIRRIGPVVDPVGPQAVPVIVGVCLILGGGSVAVARIRRWNLVAGPLVEPEGEPDEAGVPASALQAGAIMALSFGWILALPILGYVIVTP